MPKYWAAAAFVGAFSLLGCGSGVRTYPVSGTVTFDGKPVPNGEVIFLDVERVVGPDAGPIKDGKFDFKTTAGKKRVEIRATRVEKVPIGKPGAMGETAMPVDYIPERYNTRTELTAEVTSDGPNQYEFQLKPK